MNFTQSHERLRLELLRRIQRGSLTISQLARKTGLAQAHLSNFLLRRRHLSMKAMDRLLAVEGLALADLLPETHRVDLLPGYEERSSVPVVSPAVAMFEPHIRPAAVQGSLHLSGLLMQSFRSKPLGARKTWERFVAIRIPPAEIMQMDPLVQPGAIVLIDRHYNSLLPYRPRHQNIYAVRNGSHLALRYVQFAANRVVLRPYNNDFPVQLIELAPGQPPHELLVGRVALIMSEM